jgi:hypothetical protein
MAVAKKRATRTIPGLRRFPPAIMTISSIFTQFSCVGLTEKKQTHHQQAFNVVSHVDIKDRQQQSAVTFSAPENFN